jgi:hypothetical protein
MKKQRGLKRYYRNLASQNDFEKMQLDFSNADQWFDMWHLHFDWKGFGNNSFKRRKPHLDKLFRHFEILAEKLKVFRKEFHLFALLNDYESKYDSLYIHTSNPNQHGRFPLEWPYLSITDTLTNKNLQVYLDNLVGYVKLYGKCADKNETYCLLYKNNVGIPIVYERIMDNTTRFDLLSVRGNRCLTY